MNPNYYRGGGRGGGPYTGPTGPSRGSWNDGSGGGGFRGGRGGMPPETSGGGYDEFRGGGGGQMGSGVSNPGYPPQQQQQQPPFVGNTGGPARSVNDCEIIVLCPSQQAYAESIEKSLKESGLKVDLMFPKSSEIKLVNFIEKLQQSGTFFAIVIRADNEAHKSVSVHVLKNVAKAEEHRNMPLQAAYSLIRERFFAQKRKESTIPEEIRTITNCFLEEKHMTENDYKMLITYLQERKKKLILSEGRRDPDDEITEQLKQRIMIMMGFPKDSAAGRSAGMMPQIGVGGPYFK